ncbi:TonB C-terminal domain-containing protein [Sulfurimonas sp. NW9]|uniref:TonB C-terminal domain-containing protein n=1 Tax=Sulfurimonas sp. NW9 TaxID=2922728 RepID=UPI003DAA1394
MDNNSRYFYISGFLSLFLFAFFLFSFLYMMFHASKTKAYGYKKENYISVSINVTNTKHPMKKKSSKTVPATKKVVKNIDINNLFSDVWTKKIDNSVKKVKKTDNKRRIEQITRKIRPTKQEDRESVTQKISTLQASHDPSKSEATSAANEVNEYLAKIQDIVYQHFNVPQNSEGNSVKTVIELDPFGKLIDFRILSYSKNEALNEEADRIKERLKDVVFPVNPKNRPSRTIVILISKE